MYFEKSPAGLADGDDIDPLPDVLLPEVLLPDVLPPVVLPVLPPVVVPVPELPLPDVLDGVLEPELPELLLPVPPVLDCAAATAGANAITAAMRTRKNFTMLTSLDDWYGAAWCSNLYAVDSGGAIAEVSRGGARRPVVV